MQAQESTNTTNNSIKPYAWLMKLLQKSGRKQLYLVIGMALSQGVLLILQASCLAHIVNKAFILHWSLKQLIPLLSVLIILILARAGLAYFHEHFSFKTSLNIRSSLRENILSHLIKLGPIHHYQLQSAGLSNRYLEQVDALHDFFAYYLPQMTIAVILPLVILAFVFPLNWIAGLVLIITAPLIPLFMALIGMGAESIHKKHFQALSRMSNQFFNLLQGLATIKLFGQCQQQMDRTEQVANEFRLRTMSVLKVAFLSSAVLELFSSLSIALLAVYLGMSLLGYIHMGFFSGSHFELAFFILLLAPEFYAPLRSLGTHYHARAKAIAAAEDLIEFLNLQPQQERSNNPDYEINNHPSVEFNHVSLSFKDNITILSDINLTIRPYEKIVIVGASGAGKSSLLNCLTGFIKPTQGNVNLNHQDLRLFSRDSVHQQFTWLGQDPKLFPGTIKENILMNAQEDEQRLNEVLTLAHVRDFLDCLPEGISTKISEQNHGLSGGQVQRVALARALYKKAKILLLDEPTAHLNQSNRRLIMESIMTVANHYTVIMVTHEFDDLKHFDRILVMEDGKLVDDLSYSKFQSNYLSAIEVCA